MKPVNVTGVLLAAGNSKRMGESKLHLPIGESTVGSESLLKALSSHVDTVLVVVQQQDCLDWMTEEVKVQQDKFQIVRCKKACLGQSYSIKAGIRQAKQDQADGAVIMLGDQPFLQVDIINDLVDTFRANLERHLDVQYIAASYADILQPPILFRSALFKSLLSIQGDQGARSILKAIHHQGDRKQYRDWKSFYDIDTKDDYQWAKKLVEKH
ncbi:nucleotidyltransferase family protein [Gracilibacillus caseinilyticus]|uniref:Nucleotidyltransferase family protein n=1 Tax=Gracilibacillus caseinilyticus TaxID=2932256 RepID=A0ABY4EZT2_9BACI|nr:nucleotidyltransferase family protein [Gracilibacillus caseinilyticus]UOQ49914.1 nucleotidyltransferase family protein [Gracilibacillus caseinilyticus]